MNMTAPDRRNPPLKRRSNVPALTEAAQWAGRHNHKQMLTPATWILVWPMLWRKLSNKVRKLNSRKLQILKPWERFYSCCPTLVIEASFCSGGQSVEKCIIAEYWEQEVVSHNRTSILTPFNPPPKKITKAQETPWRGGKNNKNLKMRRNSVKCWPLNMMWPPQSCLIAPVVSGTRSSQLKFQHRLV